MAIDNFLAKSVCFSPYTLILRTYKWSNPALSCGYHQKTETRIDFDSCSEYGVEVVRRPTGGRELLHDGDLSFSISIRKDQNGTTDGEYFGIAAELIAGCLGRFGLRCEIKGRARKGHSVISGPCMISASEREITVGGKKIAPMAQRVFRDSILIHGSIPLAKSSIPISKLLISNDREFLEKMIERGSTDLQSAAGRFITPDLLAGALRDTFRRSLGCDEDETQIAADELTMALADIENWKIEQDNKLKNAEKREVI